MDDREGPYRPSLVKIIARFEALTGLGVLCFGIVLVALSDLIPKGDLSISDLGKDGIMVYGYSAIVLGIISFIVATGVWSLSDAGRRAAIISMVVGIFVPILVAGYLGQITFVFNLIIYPLVIYYLSREDTRKYYK